MSVQYEHELLLVTNVNTLINPSGGLMRFSQSRQTIFRKSGAYHREGAY